MGFEVRRVPAGWAHPRGPGDGYYEHVPPSEYRPLRYGGAGQYEDLVRDWTEEAWANGWRPDYGRAVPASTRYEAWNGPSPEEKHYMLVGVPTDQLTHFQMYETVTEGTPVGPVLESAEAAEAHLREHIFWIMRGYDLTG